MNFFVASLSNHDLYKSNNPSTYPPAPRGCMSVFFLLSFPESSPGHSFPCWLHTLTYNQKKPSIHLQIAPRHVWRPEHFCMSIHGRIMQAALFASRPLLEGNSGRYKNYVQQLNRTFLRLKHGWLIRWFLI